MSATALGAGAGIGFMTALGAIATTLRGLRRHSARAMLSGALESTDVRGRRVRLLQSPSPRAWLTALLLVAGAVFGTVSDVGGFFGAGMLLLVALVCLTALYLRREHPARSQGLACRPGATRVRNATHRPGRSLLSIALIASAIFVIVSVEAFRKAPQIEALRPRPARAATR